MMIDRLAKDEVGQSKGVGDDGAMMEKVGEREDVNGKKSCGSHDDGTSGEGRKKKHKVGCLNRRESSGSHDVEESGRRGVLARKKWGGQSRF